MLYNHNELNFLQTRNIIGMKPTYEVVLRVLKNKKEQLKNTMKALNFDKFEMLEILEVQKQIETLKTFLTLNK